MHAVIGAAGAGRSEERAAAAVRGVRTGLPAWAPCIPELWEIDFLGVKLIGTW